MKAIIEVEFDGCLSGCPYLTDAAMGPNYCTHKDAPKEDHLIIGYSKSRIPKGKKHPDWCPVAKEQKVCTQ